MAISPAPWTREHWRIRCSDQTRSTVAKVIPWDESGCRQEDQDNMNLIVNAPELLGALKIAKHLLDGIIFPADPNMQIIIKALKKVEGK